MDGGAERREFFRVDLSMPLCASMEIVKVHESKVKTGQTNVCIKDIGPGGLRFVSGLKMPVKQDILLGFRFDLFGKKASFIGEIVRSTEIVEDIREYGVQFEVDEKEQSKYIGLFNQLTIKVRKYGGLRECSVCTKENYIRCLKV